MNLAGMLSASLSTPTRLLAGLGISPRGLPREDPANTGQPVVPRRWIGRVAVSLDSRVAKERDEVITGSLRIAPYVVGHSKETLGAELGHRRALDYRGMSLRPPLVIHVPLRTSTHAWVPSGRVLKYFASVEPSLRVSVFRDSQDRVLLESRRDSRPYPRQGARGRSGKCVMCPI
jgi:hypothetical protein